ncbi:vacuolar protein sorting-associated protein 53 [Pilobolus umbonatus]|nr:vacuolar protein sorting-associated protein 53 [Pilobolus umbonatus]
MSNTVEISPELETQALSILKAKSPLDSPDFNPIEYLNKLFVNEQSLSSIDTVLTKLDAKLKETSGEAERLTDAQSTKGAYEGTRDLNRAKEAIQELFKKIQDIKAKATQSESMVQNITHDVKSLDYAKKHLTASVTVLKRLQMLVTAVDQLETVSNNKQYKESAQLLQAVIQLMQHFKSFKAVPQISHLSDRINNVQRQLETFVLRELEYGFNIEGGLMTQNGVLHDACLTASVLGEDTKEKIIKRYVDLQLVNYRQIFRPMEEVSQVEQISRRYAFLKRILKSCDEEHANIFPAEWAVSGRICERFCDFTRSDLEQVMKNNTPDVKGLLKALQLTIEFEGQLSKKYDKVGDEMLLFQIRVLTNMFHFEKRISAVFQPYLYLYIDTEDATIASMIDSYTESDTHADVEDDGSMVVLPSSTDLFYFYRETLDQCAKFSKGQALFELSQVFAKHLISYCNTIILGGLKKPVGPEHFRFSSLALNTADYCCITTSQLEEKLKEEVEEIYTTKIDLERIRNSFMSAISMCIDATIRCLEQSFDSQFSQMTRISWSTIDTVGDQSDFITQIQDRIKRYITVFGRNIANRRYFRTFCDRFAEIFITKYLVNIFKCKTISEIGAEQLLLDTHAIKTMLMDIPSMSNEPNTTVPNSYIRIVNKGVNKAEVVLKTVMSPIEPPEGFVENYLLLIGDKNTANFTRLLELKGIKKAEHPPLLEVFQKRIVHHDKLLDNSHIIPSDMASTVNNNNIPNAITSIASSAASNFNTTTSTIRANIPNLSPGINSPTEGTRGRLNENFRKLVLTGMAFRKDLQDRRDHTQ